MTSPDLEPSLSGRFQSRLQTYLEIGRDGRPPLRQLGELASRLPFRLGESPRDWTIPYAWDNRLDELGRVAVLDLCAALTARRQPGSEALPPRYKLRRGLQPWGSRLASTASELDPNLDPVLIQSWCDRSAGGLGEELSAVFVQALEAELAVEQGPPYGQLAALVCVHFAEALKNHVKSLGVRGMTYERLEKAIGFALFALVETSALRAIQEVERRPRPRGARSAVGRVLLLLNPLLYCSIRSRALQNPLNPWSLSEKASEVGLLRRGESWGRLSVEKLGEQLLDHLLKDAKVRAQFQQVGRTARLRFELLRLLWEFDLGTEEPWEDLRAALVSEQRLQDLQSEPRVTLHRLSQVGALVRGQEKLRDLLGAGPQPEDLQAAVACGLAFGLDRSVAEETDGTLRTLRNERIERAGEDWRPTYERGRLYRFSADGQPILQRMEGKSSGFLFVDLKGFTERTARAKEIVIADFLRREFYDPILGAAGKVARSPAEAVRLLNLVGDAAVFEGNVDCLVRLAGEIHGICSEYQKKLAGVDPDAAQRDRGRKRKAIESWLAIREEPLLLESALLMDELSRKAALSPEQREAELRGKLSTRAAELASAHRTAAIRLSSSSDRRETEEEMLQLSREQEDLAGEARAALDKLTDLSPEDRASATLELLAQRERGRLETLNKELAQVREEAARRLFELRQRAQQSSSATLEAGVFISYGTVAEEIRVDHPVFGQQRVHIAEKLNEAARGTSRSSEIATQAAEALQRAIARTKNPKLRDPFSVRLGTASGGGLPSEIFNAGRAISGEALNAFLRETAGPRFHFQRWLQRAELHPDLTNGFLLPDQLQLIVSLEPDGTLPDALLFREVGWVRFRGFEESDGCQVFEILDGQDRWGKLLWRHHLRMWAEEARADPKRLLIGLGDRSRLEG